MSRQIKPQCPTYFVKQPSAENDLNEVIDDKSILKLEWFAVLHKPWADNLEDTREAQKSLLTHLLSLLSVI